MLVQRAGVPAGAEAAQDNAASLVGLTVTRYPTTTQRGMRTRQNGALERRSPAGCKTETVGWSLWVKEVRDVSSTPLSP